MLVPEGVDWDRFHGGPYRVPSRIKQRVWGSLTPEARRYILRALWKQRAPCVRQPLWSQN